MLHIHPWFLVVLVGACAGGRSRQASVAPPASSAAAQSARVQSREVEAPRFDYPATRREDTVDVLHGVRVPDPYRWLEGEDSDVQSWFEAQDTRARRQFAALKDVDALWTEIGALWKRIPASTDIHRGAGVFRRTRDGIVLKTLDGVEKTIFETTKLEPGVRLTDFVVSQDGQRLALELSKGGADVRTLRVLDVKTRALVDEIGGIEGSAVVWARQGFFYTFTPADVPHETRFSFRRIRFHKPGEPQANDREVLPASHDKDASDGMNPLGITTDGSTLLVRTFGNFVRRSYAVIDLSKPAWPVHPLSGPLGEVSSACVFGQSVFGTVLKADGGSDIVRVRDPKRPWEVVGHGDARFLRLNPVGAYLVLAYADGSSVRSEFYDSQFRRVAQRETSPGTTEAYNAEPQAEHVTIAREGLRTPPERVDFDPKTGQETTVATAPVTFDAKALSIDSVEALSKDGAPIPVTILRRADLVLDGSAALWAYGYGGFRVNAEQIFFPPWVVWASHGGVFAICHIRGGLEHGEAWHEGGARRNRQNSLDDFAACLAELHRRRYSSPARTMTQGWSHGAMMVSAVAVQNPGLQGVVLATVPLADMIRFPLFGRGGVSEYGDPDDKDDFAALLAFSPYHNVRDGREYPAFLITAAEKDERALPMHARKLAAALQHSSTGGEVLLKVNWGAGHMGGGKDDANRVFAEAMAFARRQFGMQ